MALCDHVDRYGSLISSVDSGKANRLSICFFVWEDKAVEMRLKNIFSQELRIELIILPRYFWLGGSIDLSYKKLNISFRISSISNLSGNTDLFKNSEIFFTYF